MLIIGACPGHSTFMPRTRLPISCCADGLRYFLPCGTPGLRACSLSCEGIERTFTSAEAECQAGHRRPARLGRAGADAVKATARREAYEPTTITEREAAKVRATADHQVAEKRAAAAALR